MMQKQDFRIEDGVLKKYMGPGGDVTIPDGVTTIGDYAFDGCTRLSTITIPDSVTHIGDSIFYGCSSLPAEIIDDIKERRWKLENDRIW